MIKGRVRSLPEGKSFGFIQTEDKKDYFFHREDFHGFWNDLITDLRKYKSIEVEFEPKDSPKGLRASQVKRLDDGRG